MRSLYVEKFAQPNLSFLPQHDKPVSCVSMLMLYYSRAIQLMHMRAQSHLVRSLAVVTLFVLAAFSSCGRSAKTLLIYTPHGQDLLKDFVARYKAVHPDVDVQFLDMGSREILERIRHERNRPQADLWWGAAHTTFQTAADENLLAPYKPSWSDKIAATSRDPQDRWYGTFETPEVIVYNSEAVSGSEVPRDWDDVLEPKWRDKVLIRNPVPSDTMRVIFGSIVYRSFKDTGSPDKGYEWLRKLDANVHEYTADGTLLMQKLARREGLVSLWDMPTRVCTRNRKVCPSVTPSPQAALLSLSTLLPLSAALRMRQKPGSFTSSSLLRKAWYTLRRLITEFRRARM